MAELAFLRSRVFDYLASHPDGTSLSALEQEFGLTAEQIATLLENLIDEGKAERRGPLYLAL